MADITLPGLPLGTGTIPSAAVYHTSESGVDTKRTHSQVAASLASELGLGTAAYLDTGATNGDIPLVGAGDKLDNGLLNDATTSLKGIIELATQTEVDAGTDTEKAVTPATLSGFSSNTNWNCKAWVEFNGTTGTITDSYNVSGVVRNSAGNYTVSFSNNMPDTNYAVLVSGGSTAGYATPYYRSDSKAIGSVVIRNDLTGLYSPTDLVLCSLAVFSTF